MSVDISALIFRGTRGSQPAATSAPAGSLYYVTDESIVERSNGSAWEAFSGVSSANSSLYPTFTPTGDDDEFDNGSFSGWTAVNSGSHNPTITETNSRASFLMPGSDAGAELHAYMKARTINTNDWIEIAAVGSGQSQNYNMFGAIFADGATYGAGNQIIFGFDPNESTFLRGSHTNYSSFSGLTNINTVPGFPQGIAFIRLKYLGSNSWQGYTSPDGISWATVGSSMSRTLTPTHAGFFMSTWSGTSQYVWSVLYIRFGSG
jgi:hypothetical protein